MMNRFAMLLLPYTRAELPGWGRVLTRGHVLGARFDGEWENVPVATLRGKEHGYLMRLDLSDWAQRMTFFLGRYYEFGVQRVLSALLRPGDHFVDIGGNIGMITLHARSLVGANGRIDVFEPIPECARAIREHLALNQITNAHLHNCALSDSAGTMTISITSGHTGTATLAGVAPSDVVRTMQVDVKVGDEVLTGKVDAIKIDVEGFELRVLKGLAKTIEAWKPFILTELVEAQLARADTSVAEVSAFLIERGYVGYGIDSRRRRLRHRLALHRIDAGTRPGRFHDVVWAHPSQGRDLSSYCA